MSQNESKWTRKICKEIEECNGLVTAMVASRMQQPGIPDRHVCHTKWTGWIEFKGEKTKLTTLQSIFIREQNIRKPCSAFVVRSPNIVEDHEGEVLGYFNGTGKNLLLCLEGIERDG